jgi:hypothetical protein
VSTVAKPDAAELLQQLGADRVLVNDLALFLVGRGRCYHLREKLHLIGFKHNIVGWKHNEIN